LCPAQPDPQVARGRGGGRLALHAHVRRPAGRVRRDWRPSGPPGPCGGERRGRAGRAARLRSRYSPLLRHRGLSSWGDRESSAVPDVMDVETSCPWVFLGGLQQLLRRGRRPRAAILDSQVRAPRCHLRRLAEWSGKHRGPGTHSQRVGRSLTVASLHQFAGNVAQAYGGDAMNIDQDYLNVKLSGSDPASPVDGMGTVDVFSRRTGSRPGYLSYAPGWGWVHPVR
jgi:hypothetical protein